MFVYLRKQRERKVLQDATAKSTTG